MPDSRMSDSYYVKIDDADSYGDANDSVESCSQPSGYIDNDEDCDDTAPETHPNGQEICDNLDNDCDGSIDEGLRNACGGCGFLDAHLCERAGEKRIYIASLRSLFLRRENDNHDLTLGRRIPIGGGKRRKRPFPESFMQFGQLACDNSLSIAKGVRHRGKHGAQSRRGLIEDQRRINTSKLFERLCPRALFCRKKPRKEKPVAGRPRRRQGRKGGAGAGHGIYRNPFIARGADQLVTGIGDQRRSCIGDEADDSAVLQLFNNLRPDLRRVVVVIGRARRLDAISRTELRRLARILAQNEIGFFKDFDGAIGYVGEIADGRRRHIKAGFRSHILHRHLIGMAARRRENKPRSAVSQGGQRR